MNSEKSKCRCFRSGKQISILPNDEIHCNYIFNPLTYFLNHEVVDRNCIVLSGIACVYGEDKTH